jgi:DNA-binding CsgD family transcriptional regulator
LGYKDKIFQITDLIKLIHPDDFNEVYQLTKNAFDIIYASPASIYSFKYNITYRIKTKKNQYIRILRETSPLLAGKNGKLICNVSRCTDITYLGHHNEIKAWLTFPYRVIDLANKLNNILSKREKEILYYLAKGYSSKKIAESLSISKLTVDKHRINMLRKTGVQNTSELIKFAIEKGII